MKVSLVLEVEYDGNKLGRCWRIIVCATPEAIGAAIEILTKPVEYGCRPGKVEIRKFEPHVHRGDGETLIGFRDPVPTFVYVTEREVRE